MKTQPILPFAVFGILLALLLAVSACGGGGDGFSGDEFGGPYPFAFSAEKLIEKKVDFECSKKIDLSLSKAVMLNEDLFERSIRANYEFPDRTDTQKYNYVINGRGEIIVAQWNVENVEQALERFEHARESGQALDDTEANATNRDQPCGGRRCEVVDGDFMGDDLNRDLNKIMVNWYPEDKKANPRSPCWLDGNRENGLLDAISKHLLLAQGKDTTIAEFKWQDWMVADVAYAGEILVDLRNCAYWVTEDSGTYQPDGGRMLARARQHFAKQVSITVPDVSGKCELSLPR